MKKLLWLLLLLPFFADAQIPVIRGSDAVTAEDYRLYTLKNFRLPVFADTTAANVAKGIDSVGTMISLRGTKWVFIRTLDANGVHKWDTLGGTSSGGGGGTDTIFVTPIGTAAGMIQTLYAVDGNLRVSNWGPGYGTLPFLAGDSLAYIDIDTLNIAYKTWVINQFGPGGPMASGWDDVLSQNQNQTTDRSINGNSNALTFTGFDSVRIASDIMVGNSKSIYFGQSSPYGPFISGDYSSGLMTVAAPNLNLLGLDSIVLVNFGGGFKTGTAAYNLAVTAEGRVIEVTAGGGSGGGIGLDTVQAYTSGTTLTQGTSTNYIQVNPASVQATLTITTLASGGTWHTSNDLYIVFGGTVTSGNPVITSFTLTAGSGLTIVESTAFSGNINAGDVAHYHKIGTILYRVP